MKVELIGKHQIIMSNPYSKHQYFGWPSAIRLQNGRIAVGASGFRIGHIGPFGKAVVAYSENEGETYTQPAVVIDTVLDDRDVGFCTFGESGLIVTSFNCTKKELREMPDGSYTEEENKYKLAYLDTLTEEEEARDLGGTFRISRDCGVTFGPIYKSPISSPHGPIELSDGSVLWVGETHATYGISDKLRIEAHKINVDDGSMERIGIIDDIIVDGEVMPVYEPYACQLSDGRIICHIRVHSRKNPNGTSKGATIFQCESCDGGKTWTTPVEIIHDDEPDGATSHIIEHSSGVLIAVYGHRAKANPPLGVRAMFSTDGGRSWDKHHVIYNNAYELEGPIVADVGYPTTVELSDGSLLTVFYGRVNQKSANIMQQKWRIVQD